METLSFDNCSYILDVMCMCMSTPLFSLDFVNIFYGVIFDIIKSNLYFFFLPVFDFLKSVTGVVWNDVILLDDVLPEAALSDQTLEVLL